MYPKVLYFPTNSAAIAVLHDFKEKCVKKPELFQTRVPNSYFAAIYFLTTATSFIFALISIEIDERSIFNFPAMVSITIVFSANSEIFP